MKKSVRKFEAFVLAVVLITAVFPAPSAGAFSAPQITSKGAFVMDYQTGQEIWGKNSDTPLVPASMTKVMTVYLVYDAIEAGKLSKSDVVPISQETAVFSRHWSYANVPLNQEGIYTVDELLAAVICSSACAATVALAEMLGGSEEGFVVKMNEKAAELGLDAQYYDCFGGSPQNRITPRSMAMLGCRLLYDHPDYLTYSARRSFSFHGGQYYTTNPLLVETKGYDGVADGIKTGFINASGYCLCASALKDGQRIITVVMGASTTGERYQDSVRLINSGFSYLEEQRAAGGLYATPSSSDIYLDGRRVEISPYLVNGNNYFKLRDLAWALNGTDAAFQLTYRQEDKSVYVTSGQNYMSAGGEGGSLGAFRAWARPNMPSVYLDGESVCLTSYLINGSNYVKLWDVGALLGFGVDWDEENRCVLISTGNTENTMFPSAFS